MPAILERLVKQLKAKGKSDSSAWAIATATLQRSGDLKKGTREATAKGARRGMMTPAQRAIDRARKSSKRKHHPLDYRYSSKTNRATLKWVNY